MGRINIFQVICVTKSCLVEGSFKVQERTMDFNISEYKMVLDRVLDSTLLIDYQL